jgi:gluconolactonase
VTEYDGEPNGLKIHRDGRAFIADYRNGILELDLKTGATRPVIERRYTERFKGVNDLFFAANGDLYFTDQGRTGHQDPTGKVYRLTPDGRLQCLLSCGLSPNGLVTNADETVLYVAMTNANAIWHLSLMPDGDVTSVGTFVQLSGGGGPDGLALTEDGGLVVAHARVGIVWIFDARGRPLYRVNSAASDFVTNVAFGGPDNRTLYITDAGDGVIQRAELPVAGRPMFSHAGGA